MKRMARGRRLPTRKTAGARGHLPAAADLKRTVLIENVAPAVDGGRYPVKREVGAVFEVAADIFKEGHEVLVAFLLYRRAGEREWRETPMRLVDNDRWTGAFTLRENARWVYTIEALADPFRSWLADLAKRVEAGQDVASELAGEATALGLTLDTADGKAGATRMVARALDAVAAAATEARVAEALALIEGANRLGLRYGLWASQNRFFEIWNWHREARARLQPLGAVLGFRLGEEVA